MTTTPIRQASAWAGLDSMPSGLKARCPPASPVSSSGQRYAACR